MLGSDIIQSEELLIGSCLVDPRNLDEIAGMVSPADFADRNLGDLFEVLTLLRGIGKPIRDVRVVVDELKLIGAYGPGKIDATRLGSLIDKSVGSDAGVSAERVRGYSKRRSVIRIGDTAAEALDESIPVDGTVNRIRDQLDALDHSGDVDSVRIGVAATEVIQELDKPERAATVFSGVFELDSVVGGYRPGEMVVLAARPGAGKSSLALQIAEHNAANNGAVLFVSLEMSRSELAARMLSQRTGVIARAMRAGKVSSYERESLVSAAGDLQDLALSVWDPPSATMQQIRARAMLEARRHGMRLLVLDYLQLVEPSDGRRSRYEQVSEISRMVKRVAKDVGVPVLALAQLNREAEAEVPRLSHLRDSGSIEQDADIVLFLHPKSEPNTADRERDYSVIVAKHRHGETGKFDLTFDAPATRFVSRVKAFSELDF